MIQATLCFIFKGDPPNSVLLGYKKRGFGVGKFDGFGGKSKPGETLFEAASRELEEEAGLVTQPTDLDQCGIIMFTFPNRPAWDQEVHVFIARKWNGTPSESEEMRPEWFQLNSIPYERMWDDSHIWLPRVLGHGGFATTEIAISYLDQNYAGGSEEIALRTATTL